MNTIKLEQCKKSKTNIDKIICCICKNIPIKLCRDRNNLNNAYCEECAKIKKIKKSNPTFEDKFILDNLIIDCERFCGQTFNYIDIRKYLIHKKECNYNFDENNQLIKICFRCNNDLSESEHDCLLGTNKRIINLENRIEKRLFDIESNINKIIQIINKDFEEHKDEIKNKVKTLKEELELESNSIRVTIHNQINNEIAIMKAENNDITLNKKLKTEINKKNKLILKSNFEYSKMKFCLLWKIFNCGNTKYFFKNRNSKIQEITKKIKIKMFDNIKTETRISKIYKI